jgi:hypothetical protein
VRSDRWAQTDDLLKDEALDRLADEFNVAQFVSYRPGPDLTSRYCRIRGHEGASTNGDQGALVEILLSRSSTGTVNIRTFRSGIRKGNPFKYGIDSARDAIETVRKFAADGFYVIVNETIAVDDGGVSGVRVGGITEFAPDATPRVVEEADVLSADDVTADAILATVYGIRLPLPPDGSLRVEFSVHPGPVGYRHEPWIFWEVERVRDQALEAHFKWPNRFSQHLGDKAFGLLMGHLAGIAVPKCSVLARRVPPFEFGVKTETHDRWLRTCPRSFSPGKYPTEHGWTDPFQMMADADPSGERIASVLVQDGVEAEWSGAARVAHGDATIEGVRGSGEDFMLGLAHPADLPATVTSRVKRLLNQAVKRFGPVRIEWVADTNQMIWLIQLNQMEYQAPDVIAPGIATQWRRFAPSSGLDELRNLLEEATREGFGIEITEPVGLTSHVGDLLRSANVPARFSK